ncbi:MAG: hypothetical protein KAI35_02940, partial [Desulfobulbaceae bacterium]|nr:hypothetical protein [Desulfobulbaceae bacterium]
ATNGSILDGGDKRKDIKSDSLRLEAGKGVGISAKGKVDSLEIDVFTVAALVGSGGIYLIGYDSVGAVDSVSVYRVRVDTTLSTKTDGALSGYTLCNNDSIIQQIINSILIFDFAQMSAWYHLPVQRNGDTYVFDWVDEATVWEPAYVFSSSGFYEWTVQPWSSNDGFRAVSDLFGFRWNILDDVTLYHMPLAEDGTTEYYFEWVNGEGWFFADEPEHLSLVFTTGEDVVIKWTSVSEAVRHHIIVERNGVLYASEWLEECTEWAPGYALPSGSYEWRVESIDSQGFEVMFAAGKFVVKEKEN